MNNMDVISCAKTTMLSSFPDFTLKYEHRNNDNHQSGSGFDFQFFNGKPLYAQFNKRNRIEFFRIKSSSLENGNPEIKIERVKKLLMDNLCCIGVPKTRNINKHNKDLALGFANGHIKFVNYYTSETSDTIFHNELRSNGVIHIDYNSTDEYLSAVYENGNINLYGIKTKTKLETLKMDNSTFTKFHPTRKSHLSIATYKGSTYIYDLHSKRKIFQSVDSHSAPCRDVCFSVDQPDLFITAGFDCVAKIYDTRKRAQPLQIKCRHPISCIAVSDCGIYCCMGNLKGQLLAYDLRQLRNHLAWKKAYDDGVSRIAFLPKELYKEHESFESASVQNYSEIEPVRKSVGIPNTGRDSFYEFLDFHVYRGNQKEDRGSTNLNRFSIIRDSFDWNLLNKRKSTDLSENCLNEISNPQPNIAESFSLAQQQAITSGQPNSNDSSKLSLNVNSLIVSTSKTRLTNVAEELDDLHEPNNSNSRSSQLDKLEYGVQQNITKQIEQLQLEFNKRLNDLQFEMKYTAETNKWQSYTQNCNFWNKQLDFNESLKNAIEILLKTDSFFLEFEKLKEENELLKRKLGEKKY